MRGSARDRVYSAADGGGDVSSIDGKWDENSSAQCALLLSLLFPQCAGGLPRRDDGGGGLNAATPVAPRPATSMLTS